MKPIEHVFRLRWTGGALWELTLEPRISNTQKFARASDNMEEVLKKARWKKATRADNVWTWEAPVLTGRAALDSVQNTADMVFNGTNIAFEMERPPPGVFAAATAKASAPAPEVVAPKPVLSKRKTTVAKVHAMSLETFRKRSKTLSKDARHTEFLWWLEFQAAKIPLPIDDLLDALKGKVR